MDLSDFVPKRDYITVILTHPKTGEPLTNDDGSEMSVDAWLPHSEAFKEVRFEMADKMIEEKADKLSSRQADEMQLYMIAKTVKTWDITFEGSKPDLTVEKAKEVFSALPFIRRQVEQEVEQQEVFI